MQYIILCFYLLFRYCQYFHFLFKAMSFVKIYRVAVSIWYIVLYNVQLSGTLSFKRTQKEHNRHPEILCLNRKTVSIWFDVPVWPGEFHGLYSSWGHRVRQDWATFTSLPFPSCLERSDVSSLTWPLPLCLLLVGYIECNHRKWDKAVAV